MKRIMFILSLILMIGIQAKALSPYLYEGACLDIVQHDPSQDFFYNCDFSNCNILPIYAAIVTPTVVNGYTQSMKIPSEILESEYTPGYVEYLDIPVQAQYKQGSSQIYNCYIRIQFIK